MDSRNRRLWARQVPCGPLPACNHPDNLDDLALTIHVVARHLLGARQRVLRQDAVGLGMAPVSAPNLIQPSVVNARVRNAY